MVRRGARRPYSRAHFLFLAAFFLSGCDILSNAEFLNQFRREPAAVDTSAVSEQGIGKLAKGEILQAQALFNRALQANPRDVYALLGNGMILQQTGQVTQARANFEAILALRPDENQRLVVLNNLQPQTVQELASVNLSLLQSQGVPSSFGQPAEPARPSTGATINPGQSGRIAPRTMAAPPAADEEPAMAGQVSGDDANVVGRFETLKSLLDDGLITPDEFQARRNKNIGALLPLTKPRPALGLERSVPSAAQISQRLRAIRRALELRAITVRQHGAERTTIIDGLMPLNPPAMANPAPPPEGLLAAADAVRRLEIFRDRGLITPAEYTAEKDAIEKTLQPAAAPQASASPQQAEKQEAAAPAGPRPAVHIASFRSEQAAERGWAQLRRAHRALLGELQREITRVNLGRGRGVFYRLIAGPLQDQAEVSRVCRQLKARRQYCEPAFISGGG